MLAIMEREFFERMKSGQFLMLLLASIILFSASGLIFARRERLQAEEYARLTSEPPRAPEYLMLAPWFRYGFGMPEFDTKGGPNYPRPSTVATELYASPCPLLFIAEGGDSRRPSGYIVRPGGILEALPERPHNFKMPNLPPIDWAFIISVVFSLYALLFGHNSISGEREDGTLRLTLSNPVSRAKLLAAKYSALMLLLLIPLAIGMAFSLLLLAVIFPHAISGNAIAYCTLIIVPTVGFISIFILLSLLVSARIGQSAVGLLVILTVWVLAVNFPNIAELIAEQVAGIPGERSIVQRLRDTRKENDRRLKNAFFNRSSPTFRGAFTTEEDALKAAKPMLLEAHKALWIIRENYRNTVENSQRITRMIANISPVALFRTIAERFAGSGMVSEDRFLRDVQAYSQTYDRYIEEKLGEVDFKTEEMINAQHFYIAYGSGGVELPDPKEYDGGKSDFPRFEPHKRSSIDVLHDSLLSLSGLLLWNLLLALGAFLAFNRADVR